jgi:hypothetical protein
MKKTIKMEFTKSTKGTHVYANNDADTPVSTIYIKRNGLPSTPPATITLSLEFNEDSNGHN